MKDKDAPLSSKRRLLSETDGSPTKRRSFAGTDDAVRRLWEDPSHAADHTDGR